MVRSLSLCRLLLTLFCFIYLFSNHGLVILNEFYAMYIVFSDFCNVFYTYVVFISCFMFLSNFVVLFVLLFLFVLFL